VTTVSVPLRGPRFGSYLPDEVAWLLTDLSEAPLEAPAEEREPAIQSGAAHYAESLPIERVPTPFYERLFFAALARSARRVARDVGVLTEQVLAERGPRPVLASLARAGTPIGILMRRWAAFAHGVELPHYAISVVRGRGVDRLALHYLADRHPSEAVVFVDGWTGKGAIAGELTAALCGANDRLGTAFRPDLAVLVDPGGCARTFASREDYLVPSACLNSTVSGLVSRTVLNPRLLGPTDFHGAKFYAQLSGSDLSRHFLDAICAEFPAVQAEVSRMWPTVATGDRTAQWQGLRVARELASAHGSGDVALVKPGIGETTRVLLRRVPWRVLVRPDAGPDVDHVRLLAADRGVPVLEADLPGFSCAGIVAPAAGA
jgi:hypothetical protein